MQDNILEYTRAFIMKAQLCREYYISLIDQGFEKNEALELCKNFKIQEL